jgi:hypothetical protein
MLRKTLFLSLLISLALLVAAPPTFAKSKNKGKGKSSQFKTMARLTTCCGDPAPGVKGHVDYKAKTKKGRVEEIDLKTVVELTPNIAAALPPDPDLRLILSDGGVEYAECFLVPEGEDDDEGEDDENENEVEFKLDLRQKKGRFEEKKGSCDTDLVTTGVQRGIPVIEVGDVATITFVRDPLDRSKDIDFLMGVFE